MKLSFWESGGPIIADAQSKEPSLALMIRHYYRSYSYAVLPWVSRSH